MSADIIEPIEHPPLHDRLVERLRALIVDGALAPGAKLSERELCGRFGVSRTPLREAMKVLAVEGLVQITPRRGVRVSRITEADLAETFPVIGALEALAGELACARVTEREIGLARRLQARLVACHDTGDLAGYFEANQAIHRLILETAANETLSAMTTSLSSRVRRARYLANLSPERWAEAVEEHGAILKALEARDGAGLGRLLRQHLEHKHQALLAALRDAGLAG